MSSTRKIVIPSDLALRIQVLGEDPTDYSETFDQLGEDFLRRHVESCEMRVGLLRTWFPKLKKFAVKCRSQNRGPISSPTAKIDHAKLSIYKAKIFDAPRFSWNNTAIVCLIPQLGIQVAQELWPGKDDQAIILTPEEWKQWLETYEHPQGMYELFVWWAVYSWEIEDPPDPTSFLNKDLDMTMPDGESAWLVSSGLWTGELSSHETAELWSWNGQEPRYIRTAYTLDS